MDQYRIQASVLSFGDLQVTVGPVDDRRATTRAVTDYARDLVQTRGDRFGIFAVTPMPDIEGSVAEVDRALGELDLDGICLLTNYKGTYLGDPSFAPLYEISATRTGSPRSWSTCSATRWPHAIRTGMWRCPYEQCS